MAQQGEAISLLKNHLTGEGEAPTRWGASGLAV